MPVITQMVARAVPAPAAGTVVTAGTSTPKYPTKATPRAAVDDQREIQYPHAMRKPGSSPKAARVYAYGPPIFGRRLARDPSTSATNTVPPPVKSQPKTLRLP